jgi:acetoin utilization deacetylase AcuC-like enzyme
MLGTGPRARWHVLIQSSGNRVLSAAVVGGWFAYSPSYIADIEPNAATREQLLRVHTERYLDDLEHCRWIRRTAQSELPLGPQIVRLFVLACGGTIYAAELALREGAWDGK